MTFTKQRFFLDRTQKALTIKKKKKSKIDLKLNYFLKTQFRK